jgi:hypothetical protein
MNKLHVFSTLFVAVFLFRSGWNGGDRFFRFLKSKVFRLRQKVRPALGGRPAARESGLGTGRGGDVTGSAELLSVV